MRYGDNGYIKMSVGEKYVKQIFTITQWVIHKNECSKETKLNIRCSWREAKISTVEPYSLYFSKLYHFQNVCDPDIFYCYNVLYIDIVKIFVSGAFPLGSILQGNGPPSRGPLCGRNVHQNNISRIYRCNIVNEQLLVLLTSFI